MVDIIRRQLQKIENDINVYVNKSRIHSTLDLVNMKTGVKPARIILGVCVILLVIYLIFGRGNDFLCDIIGFIFPAYASLKTIQTSETFDRKQLLRYWVIYSFLKCIEYFLHKLFDYLTFYWLGKVIFLAWYWKYFSPKKNIAVKQSQEEDTSANENDVELQNISIINAMEDAPNQNLDQLEPSFMYSQILKEILFDMEHGPQAIKDLASFCQKRYQDNKREIQVIKEFADTYQSSNAIWWYTRECFTYKMLNEALRTLNGDIIIRMGFFLCDIHQQIEELYRKQISQHHGKPFKVYRGQRLSINRFEKLSKSKDGLLSFNSFLSTSQDRNTSLKFAKRALTHQDTIGVLFEMIIDPNVMSSSFAFVQEMSRHKNEAEVLFTMHTVFRINDIQKIDDNCSLYQVTLSFTSDDDQRLRRLTNFIREETGDGIGWIRLGYLLTKMGQFDKAEELYTALLEKTSKDSEKANFHNQLGYLKDDKGRYDEALLFYEKSLEIKRRILPENDPSIGTCYNNIGGVYNNMGNYPKAMEYYQKDLEITKKNHSENHLSLATCYNNIGGVHKKMGNFEEALEYYEKDLAITKKALPENHPDLAVSYNNIGTLYKNMDNCAKALEYYEKALMIRRLSLPEDHPDFAQSYNNIGLLFNRMGNNSRALEAFTKALKICEKTLPDNHPSLATSYNNIGTVYDSMRDFSKALENYENALKIRELSLPENHPDFAMSYNNIGLMYNVKGDHHKALQYLEKSLDIFQKSLPSTHPSIEMVKNNINEVKKNL